MAGKRVAFWTITYIDDKDDIRMEDISDEIIRSEFDSIEEYQEMDPYEVIPDYIHHSCKEVLDITPSWENL